MWWDDGCSCHQEWLLPAKSATFTSAPALISFFVCFTSPLMAAKWRGVSPRSFLLCTFLSPGVFLTEGTEGWGEVGLDDESRTNENIRHESTWSISHTQTIIGDHIKFIPKKPSKQYGIEDTCVDQIKVQTEVGQLSIQLFLIHFPLLIYNKT